MKSLKTKCFPTLLAGACFLATLGLPSATASTYPNIIKVLEQDGRFTVLLSALEATGLKPVVASSRALTLFAPTDDAFAALPEGTLASWFNSMPVLADVLNYHVVSGRQWSWNLLGVSTVLTMQGNPVLVTRDGVQLSVNNVEIAEPNMYAANGVIHVINEVLLPPDPGIQIQTVIDALRLDGRFHTLLQALETTGLTDAIATLGSFTLFAPTDAAFAALPARTSQALTTDPAQLSQVLLYHVLPVARSSGQLLVSQKARTLLGTSISFSLKNGSVYANNSRIVNPNVKAPNGLIQVVDQVLLPVPAPQNLFDVLAADGRFAMFLTALDLTGLSAMIQTNGPFTVIAPTDDAFAALPLGRIASLTNNLPELTRVMLYHMLSGRQKASGLVALRTAVTLEGSSVSISASSGSVYVNDGRLINRDVKAPNGLIQVIDTVLSPPPTGANIYEILQLDGRFKTLLTALDLTGLSEMVKTNGPFTVFAPTDAAFAALPAGTLEGLSTNVTELSRLLSYHMLPSSQKSSALLAARTVATLEGSSVKVYRKNGWICVNDARLITLNIKAPNGLIQAIDKVLTPPPMPKNIYDLLQASGRFTNFLAAVELTGLSDMLKNNGPFTVFAPTDAAFAALPVGTRTLLKANPDVLKELLLYHIVDGEKNVAALLSLRKVTTLQGARVTVYRGTDGRVYVNQSVIDPGNVDAQNGIVHVINRVLLPPGN